MALGLILLTPGAYGDKTISLNGPLTDCETAAAAFSMALGKPVIYEQASYGSYREVRSLDVKLLMQQHHMNRINSAPAQHIYYFDLIASARSLSL